MATSKKKTSKSNGKVKPKVTTSSLGELIYEARLKKDESLTQNLLGLAVGCSYNNIMMIENDRYTFRGMMTLFRIKDLLGISDAKFMAALRATCEANEENPPKVVKLSTLLDVAAG